MTNEQRIERLEQRCRWLLVSLVGVVTTGGVALFCGAAPNEPVKALRGESLEIVDEAGNVRIRLGKFNSPTLNMFGLEMKDERGDARVSMHDQAHLMLERDEGRAWLVAGAAGAALQLNGRGSRPRAMLSVRGNQAEIQLRDANGGLSWQQATPSLKVARDAGQADPFKP